MADDKSKIVTDRLKNLLAGLLFYSIVDIALVTLPRSLVCHLISFRLSCVTSRHWLLVEMKSSSISFIHGVSHIYAAHSKW